MIYMIYYVKGESQGGSAASPHFEVEIEGLLRHGSPFGTSFQVQREDKLEFCPPLTSEETRKNWKWLKFFLKWENFTFLALLSLASCCMGYN